MAVLNVTAPPNGNIAPPGYYMLFILNAAGVPSVARFVQLSTSISNQPPTAIINSPATNVTIAPGGSVFFSGSGSDPEGNDQCLFLDLPGWDALFELGRHSRRRHLLDGRHLHGLAHGDRQRRTHERQSRDAHDYGGQSTSGTVRAGGSLRLQRRDRDHAARSDRHGAYRHHCRGRRGPRKGSLAAR